MEKSWEIVLAGSGGQGLMLAGNLISVTAARTEGRNVTQRNFYGPEKRGGYASTEVRISDEEIVFPDVERPDVIVILHPSAMKEYGPWVEKEIILIYDSDCIDSQDPGLDRAKSAYGLPFTSTMRQLGAAQSVNIMALGALVQITGIVQPDHLLDTIRNTFPAKAKINEQAFLAGRELIGRK